MKNGFKVIGMLAVVMFMVAFISSASFALPDDNKEENINLELVNNIDTELLKMDIINFIDLVDNNLIPNTSFNMSSKLNENYDFLTKFAISFILDNSNYYDIIVGDNYIYKNDYEIDFSTNKYVSIDTIYEITNKVFGVDYYYILNDYLEINNDLVPLLEIEEYSFDMEIDNITSINNMGNYIDVSVKYMDMEIDYIYRFELVNDRLVISNLSIEE